MMNVTAVECWVSAVSAINSRAGETGEYFPDMEQFQRAARHDRRLAVWSSIASAPQAVTRRLSQLVPSSLRAALQARAEARELSSHIVRLEGVAPHMLEDIGLREVSAGVYEMIGQDEPVAAPLPVKPVVIRLDAPPAAPVARKPAKRIPRVPVGWSPAPMAGVALS